MLSMSFYKAGCYDSVCLCVITCGISLILKVSIEYPEDQQFVITDVAQDCVSSLHCKLLQNVFTKHNSI